MSEEPTTRNCEKCGLEISATVDSCPACGTRQEGVEPQAPASIGGFTLEDDETPPEPPRPEEGAQEETQPISSDDLPVEEIPDPTGKTIRMSVGDMGKAWLEETSDPDAETEPEPEPESTRSKRSGCLPIVLLVVIPLVVAAVVL